MITPLRATLLLLVALHLPVPWHGGQGVAAPTTDAAPWQGEYFDKRQGGLYFKVALKKFRASAQTRFMTGSVQVRVRNLLKQRDYLISHAPSDPDEAPRELWKLPSGKYEILAVTLVDTAGVKRSYAPRDREARQTFTVKRHCLANLGLWTLSPRGERGLAVAFTMVPNSYAEIGKRSESSVAAVIDGFTGLMQEGLGGRRVLEAATSNFEAGNELRATVTFTREISMFYRLDLFRHNRYAQSVSNVLSVYDANLRRCYMDRLAVNESLRGEVRFTFLLSRSTGTMAKLKHTGGTANDPKLARCIYLQLAQIQFPVPENMVGELSYTYDVR